MTKPLHQETTEVRLQYVLDRKEKDLQHMALFGPRVSNEAWEDAVHRACRQLAIYDESRDKSQDLELALYLTIQGELVQIRHQFLTKMDLWAVMDEARRRMDGADPCGPPGKKRGRTRDEKDRDLVVAFDPFMGTTRAYSTSTYYTNPAIPRWNE